MRSTPTQAEWDEICEYIKGNPRIWLDGSPEEGYAVAFSDEEKFRGMIHPMSFLDIIRELKEEK